jgi:hypothetical protein
VNMNRLSNQKQSEGADVGTSATHTRSSIKVSQAQLLELFIHDGIKTGIPY